MSNYKLYSVTVGFDLVVAVNKTSAHPRPSIEDALTAHIADIVDNLLDEDIDAEAITYTKIASNLDLPTGWEPFMLPYHRYAQEPNDLRNVKIQDILESNTHVEKEAPSDSTERQLLWARIGQLEKEVAQLKAKK
jgi:hypothetical protein